MSFFGRDYSLSLFYSPSFLLSLFLFIFPALQWAIPRKKKKLRTYFFFKKPPEISSYITYLQLFRTRLHSWNFCNAKLYQLHPLKIPEPKTKATGNSIFFLKTPGNSTSFLNNLSKLRLLFLRYRQKFNVLNPLPFSFFSWNSPMLENVRITNSKHFSLLGTNCPISKVESENSG